MEEEVFIIEYEKNEYIFKIIYLIRINIPSSEYIYMIMFFFKYIGFILFSISLNEWQINNKDNISINENETIDDENLLKNTPFNKINDILAKLLINGSDLKILRNYYQIICIIGFSLLFIYIFLVVFGIFYMKKKYYNKTSINMIEKK